MKVISKWLPRSVRDLVIVFATSASLVIVLVLCGVATFGPGTEGRAFQRRQARLLSETDHQALLTACRELSRRVASGDLKPGFYLGRHDPPHPEASRFPRVILDLEPRQVIICADGRVLVGLGVFHDACGVMACPEDYRYGPYDVTSDDIQLVPGLWYYDDDYGKYPQYDKKIEALIEKGNRRNARKGQATGALN